MRFLSKAWDFFRKTVSSLENSKAPFIYFVLTFLFAVSLRNFIELLEVNSAELFSMSLSSQLIPLLAHYYMFYVSIALFIILIFHLATRIEARKVAKVVLPSFILVLLAPALDFILSSGSGYGLSYFLPGTHGDLVFRFFTFGGDFAGTGATPGLRIELALALLLGLAYIYSKTSSLLKSVLFTFITYAMFFGYATVLFIAGWLLELLRLNYDLADLLLFQLYLILISALGVILAYLQDKKLFMALLEDMRPTRIAHFELMFIIGLLVAGFGLMPNPASNVFSLLLVPISIFFACIYSIITNNIQDYGIDKVSNKGRPLPSAKISIPEYGKLQWIFLFLALFYALAVGFQAFLIILLAIGSYFLYSMEPLRLKRVTFLSKLIISFVSLLLVMLGFYLVEGSFEGFPAQLALVLLVGFTPAMNFIDIKDYAGDKKEGIRTLPVVLGLKNAKLLIGIFFILAYLSIWFLLPSVPVIALFFALGLVQLYLVTREKYDENKVFAVYILSLLIFIFLISGPLLHI